MPFSLSITSTIEKFHAPSIFISRFLFLLAFYSWPLYTWAEQPRSHDTIIVKPGFENNKISHDWKIALTGRMQPDSIERLGAQQRALTPEELSWQKLILSKKVHWNSFKDSLALPFSNIPASDTIYVLLGYLGNDDGFTFGYQTVCLDLTALTRAYGDASLPENDNRIDRIFAHEYTHLLHKLWMQKTKLVLPTFRDSVLWECLYEGIGMYRSLNSRWMPGVNGLPHVTETALANLYPIFVDRIKTIESSAILSARQKESLTKNLSRGNVNQKWGAFPVAIWLSLEANGDDSKLQAWINKGPAAVIELARKHLPSELKL